MGCGGSTNVTEPARRAKSAPLPQSHAAAAAPLRRAASTAASSQPRDLLSLVLPAREVTANDAASSASRASCVVLLAGEVATADAASSAPKELGASVLQAGSAIHYVGGVATNSQKGDLAQISTQVLNHCADLQNHVNGQSQEGLRDLVSMLASGAEGTVQVLNSFGPIGPLFRALGIFIQHVEQVQAARGEGQRLKLWAETLIPIIRQSLLMPFPTDMDPSKRKELVQCTEQAAQAIEALQRSIQEVAKSKESWMRFFAANNYIDMMQEAQQRVEKAIDIIQKHMIADTKSGVFKITAMLKTVVWGHLTDMQKDVTDLKSNMETGFAQITTELKNVCSMPPPTCTRTHTHTHTFTFSI